MADYASIMISENPKVAIWSKTEQIVILHERVFGSVVEFTGGICFMLCELGPEYDFEIMGDL